MLKKINSYISLKKRAIFQNILKRNYKPKVQSVSGTQVTESIEKNGFFITNLEFLKANNVDLTWVNTIPDIKKLLDKREKQDLSTIKKREKGSYAVDLNILPLEIKKKLDAFAQSAFLINLIENYFKLSVFYRGVQIRKDLNDGNNIETRLWHCDGEDTKIIKIIFYLEDVYEKDGPFTFIPKKILNKKSKIKFDSHGRLNDNDILNYVNEENIHKFHGKLGDCIFVDTCSIYHKGELPINKPRYAVFFCYNSNYPLNPDFCKPLH